MLFAMLVTTFKTIEKNNKCIVICDFHKTEFYCGNPDLNQNIVPILCFFFLIKRTNK